MIIQLTVNVYNTKNYTNKCCVYLLFFNIKPNTFRGDS